MNTSILNFKLGFIFLIFFNSCNYINGCNNIQEKNKYTNTCGYGKSEINRKFCSDLMINGFTSNQDAEKAVKNILDVIGMPSANFTLVSCDSINNCFAILSENKRYVVYDNLFLKQIIDTSLMNWSSISILAHEIGHHLYGHTMNPSELDSRHKEELEADNFSGFILAKIGSTLEQAQLAINSFDHPSCDNDENVSHPCKLKRLKAIKDGWEKGINAEQKIKTTNSVIQPFKGTIPAVSDCGIENLPRFMADINNDGIVDFGRFVGNYPDVYLSFQFGKKDGSYSSKSYDFNSYKNVDKGILSRGVWLQDVNSDGLLDYCRYVGNFPNIYRAALIATQTGFDGEHYYKF